MKKEIRNEVEKNAPQLMQLLEKLPATAAPDGYFDTLEDRLMERIKAKGKTEKAPPLEFVFWKKTRWIAAASVLLVAALFWWKRDTLPTQADGQLIAAEMSDTEIEAYILENINDFDPDNLGMYLENKVDIDSFGLEGMQENLLDEYSTEELEEWL